MLLTSVLERNWFSLFLLALVYMWHPYLSSLGIALTLQIITCIMSPTWVVEYVLPESVVGARYSEATLEHSFFLQVRVTYCGHRTGVVGAALLQEQGCLVRRQPGAGAGKKREWVLNNAAGEWATWSFERWSCRRNKSKEKAIHWVHLNLVAKKFVGPVFNLYAWCNIVTAVPEGKKISDKNGTKVEWVVQIRFMVW